MNYQKFVSQKVKDIEISTIRYFFNMVNEVEGAISLCIGEPDFITPTHINQAANKALEDGRTFYSPNAGLFDLRKEISGFLQRKYGISYKPETEVIVTIGASQAIILIRTLSTVMSSDSSAIICNI